MVGNFSSKWPLNGWLMAGEWLVNDGNFLFKWIVNGW
jgi:hypothetical protein